MRKLKDVNLSAEETAKRKKAARLLQLRARRDEIEEEANSLFDDVNSYTEPHVWSGSEELDKRLTKINALVGALRFKLMELKTIEASIAETLEP